MIKLLRSNLDPMLVKSIGYAFDEVLGEINWDCIIVVRNAILISDTTQVQGDDVITLHGIDLDDLSPIHTFMKKEQVDKLSSDYTPLTAQFMYSYFLLGCKVIKTKSELIGKGNLNLTPGLEELISPLPKELAVVFYEDKSLITLIENERINLDALLYAINNSGR